MDLSRLFFLRSWARSRFFRGRGIVSWKVFAAASPSQNRKSFPPITTSPPLFPAPEGSLLKKTRQVTTVPAPLDEGRSRPSAGRVRPFNGASSLPAHCPSAPRRVDTFPDRHSFFSSDPPNLPPPVLFQLVTDIRAVSSTFSVFFLIPSLLHPPTPPALPVAFPAEAKFPYVLLPWFLCFAC